MAINLTTKYAKKTVDKFYQESVIAGWTNKDYSWDGSKSIVVSTIVTQTPGDYTRSGTSRYGTPTDVQDTIQTLTISQDKSVSLVVDKGDAKQQTIVKNSGKVLGLEIREQFVPMCDKYALSKWNTGRGSKIVLASPTKANIVGAISDVMKEYGNKSIKTDDVIIYLGWGNFAKLLQAPEFLNLEKLGVKALENGALGMLFDMKIKPVPDTYLPEGVNFLAVKKKSVLMPFQIKEQKVHMDPPGISGALMEVRYLYDAFVLDTLKDGVIACTTA